MLAERQSRKEKTSKFFIQGEMKKMARFTLPRDLYHGKGSLETLKTLKGKRAMVCVGGGSMKK